MIKKIRLSLTLQKPAEKMLKSGRISVTALKSISNRKLLSSFHLEEVVRGWLVKGVQKICRRMGLAFVSVNV
jgi:hypothetical protein